MTTTTIRRLPDGQWELTQRHDTPTSLMRAIEALPDLGDEVAVELSKPEPWDGVFRVGDEGVMRDGRPYRVTATDGTYQTAVNGGWHEQPIASIELPNGPYRNHNANGAFFGCEEESVNDLMPPTKRGPKNAD